MTFHNMNKTEIFSSSKVISDHMGVNKVINALREARKRYFVERSKERKVDLVLRVLNNG